MRDLLTGSDKNLVCAVEIAVECILPMSHCFNNVSVVSVLFSRDNSTKSVAAFCFFAIAAAATLVRD